MNHSQTSKTMLILLVIAVIAVIGFVVYSHRSIKNVPAPVSENTPLPNPAEWPSAKVSDQTISDNGGYYTINATYPIVKDDVITGYFKTFVDDSVAQFKSDSAWAAGTGAKAAPAEAASLSLTIKYTEQKTTRADNFIFSSDVYTGGAHDLQATKTFSFSATGQLITIATLFSNGDEGLKTIAPYVQQQLGKIQYADATMIQEGTAPTVDNYANFTVQDNGITFIFDPYAVAPYAAGMQTVTVPTSIFKDIANPDLFSASNAR